MKNLLLCIVLCSFLISCSTDQDSEQSENNLSMTAELNATLPQNKVNPFDSKGKKYYEALKLYHKQNQYPNSIGEMTKQLQFISKEMKGSNKMEKSVIPFNDSIVESIMVDPDQNMMTIVESSSLGSESKASLITFLQTLIEQRQQPFSVAYNYIITYENAILAETALSADDKDTLLAVSSICRYSLYSETERRDRDWETSTGSRGIRTFFAPNEVSIISVIALLDTII